MTSNLIARSRAEIFRFQRSGDITSRMIKPLLDRAVADVNEMLPKIAALAPQLQKLCDELWKSWEAGGKVLTAGNGGSAADAMHLAEELVVRFVKNRRAMPAIALCDPTVI